MHITLVLIVAFCSNPPQFKPPHDEVRTQILEVATITGGMGFAWEKDTYLLAWEDVPQTDEHVGGLWIVDSTQIDKSVVVFVKRRMMTYRREDKTWITIRYYRVIFTEYSASNRWNEWVHTDAHHPVFDSCR